MIILAHNAFGSFCLSSQINVADGAEHRDISLKRLIDAQKDDPEMKDFSLCAKYILLWVDYWGSLTEQIFSEKEVCSSIWCVDFNSNS